MRSVQHGEFSTRRNPRSSIDSQRVAKTLRFITGRSAFCGQKGKPQPQPLRQPRPPPRKPATRTSHYRTTVCGIVRASAEGLDAKTRVHCAARRLGHVADRYAQQPGKIFRIGFPWSATQPSMRLARCSVVIKISSAKINCGQRKNTSSSSSRFLTSRSPSCCRLVNGSAGDWLRARC
jgi:hypothetical protein